MEEEENGMNERKNEHVAGRLRCMLGGSTYSTMNGFEGGGGGGGGGGGWKGRTREENEMDKENEEGETGGRRRALEVNQK